MKWQRFLWCLVLLNVPVGLRAQNPDNAEKVVQSASTSVPVVSKPVRKPDQVITNDTIGLLAVRRAPRVMPVPVTETTPPKDDGAATDAAARKAAEVASLEKRIRDKQKRIALLMKLFVNDEKEFLKYGGAAEADPEAQDRRRYEQDELRWETAELAKLQVRLEELTAKK